MEVTASGCCIALQFFLSPDNKKDSVILPNSNGKQNGNFFEHRSHTASCGRGTTRRRHVSLWFFETSNPVFFLLDCLLSYWFFCCQGNDVLTYMEVTASGCTDFSRLQTNAFCQIACHVTGFFVVMEMASLPFSWNISGRTTEEEAGSESKSSFETK